MKRHEALEQLSRDHHQALFQAMRLKRAEEDNAGDVVGDFLDFWFGIEPQLGRDVFTFLLYGIRNSLLIADTATLLTTLFGVVRFMNQVGPRRQAAPLLSTQREKL